MNTGDYAGCAGARCFLANPNAPTGLCLPLGGDRGAPSAGTRTAWWWWTRLCGFGGESAACLLGRYDNLLVVGTFSKSRSLAGARLGYAVGSPGRSSRT